MYIIGISNQGVQTWLVFKVFKINIHINPWNFKGNHIDSRHKEKKLTVEYLKLQNKSQNQQIYFTCFVNLFVH